MAGLSKAQVAAMLDMGDTMARQGVDGLECPAVNGRTLAVLEREGYVLKGDLSGLWLFTIMGGATYESLDYARHVNTGAPRMAVRKPQQSVSVPMWDDVTPVAVDDVVIYQGHPYYVEEITSGGTMMLRNWCGPETQGMNADSWAINLDVSRGIIEPVTHNCGTCGPRAQAGCGWCYVCDRAGRRVLPAGLPEVSEGMTLWNPSKAQPMSVLYTDDVDTCIKYPDGSESVLETDWIRTELGNGNWEIMSPESALPGLPGVCECGKSPCRNAVVVGTPARCVLEGNGLSVRTAFRMVHAPVCTCDAAPMTPDEVAFANTPDAASIRMEDMSQDVADMLLAMVLDGYEFVVPGDVKPSKRVPRKVKKSRKARRARRG